MNLEVVDIEVSDLGYSSCAVLTSIQSIRGDTRKLSSPCAAGWFYAHSLTVL